jgi:thiamine-phosphate pyrophosphorylase
MKDASEELLEETALAVQRMCREHGATFIIDDNVLLTKRIGANGVHLGKNDMPIAEARKILGNDYIIGSTVNTFEDITNTLHSATPDYFGCGPFRYTTTKSNLSPTLGLEGYSAIVAQMRKHNISIPIVAIGGITKADIPAIMECGVSGIALSGSILSAQDPIDEMHNVLRLL